MTDMEKIIKILTERAEEAHTRNTSVALLPNDVMKVVAMLKEQEAMNECLKKKCVICPHCENCDVDEKGLLKEQETMHWISVTDRLPTYAELKDDCVLVMFDDGTICSTGFDECIEGESIFGEWRQNFDPVTLGATDSYWIPLEGVTHWMPIPKLMQEGR